MTARQPRHCEPLWRRSNQDELTYLKSDTVGTSILMPAGTAASPFQTKTPASLFYPNIRFYSLRATLAKTVSRRFSIAVCSRRQIYVYRKCG
jgi:hypothetical protein